MNNHFRYNDGNNEDYFPVGIVVHNVTFIYARTRRHEISDQLLDDSELNEDAHPTFLFIRIYRVAAVLNVKINIIARIAASSKVRAVLLLIMYVKIFKTGVILYILQ